MSRTRWIAGALAALVLVPAAGAGVTRFDADGTTLLDGAKVFPIVLAKGPEVGSTTPAGGDAFDEVVSAGVTFLKVGPATTVWTQADVDDALANDRAAAARGIQTWVNLATLSRATAGSAQDTRLHDVVAALKGDASAGAIGMWKGADEPWWSGISASSLQFAYCLATSRGTSSWCAGEAPVDSDHLWVTIQAPKGTASDLAPYSAVTDIHGVDHYPVTLANADPNLHGIGTWTATLAAATPNHAVWTTLQVCASGSSDGSGAFVLPTRLQERYMIYDAILNGARNLAFYGGNIPGCWNASDTTAGWNWTFWDGVLKPLVQEINAGSPIAPALVNPGTTRDAGLQRRDDPGDRARRRRQRRPVGDRGAERRRLAGGDDRRPARDRDERRGLHRGPVGPGGEWIVHGHVRPLGRARLPLHGPAAAPGRARRDVLRTGERACGDGRDDHGQQADWARPRSPSRGQPRRTRSIPTPGSRRRFPPARPTARSRSRPRQARRAPRSRSTSPRRPRAAAVAAGEAAARRRHLRLLRPSRHRPRRRCRRPSCGSSPAASRPFQPRRAPVDCSPSGSASPGRTGPPCARAASRARGRSAAGACGRSPTAGAAAGPSAAGGSRSRHAARRSAASSASRTAAAPPRGRSRGWSAAPDVCAM